MIGWCSSTNNAMISAPLIQCIIWRKRSWVLNIPYERAAAEQKYWPTQEQVIEAFEYSEYPTPSGTILMAIGKGHQAIEPAAYGIVDKYNPLTKEVTITNVKTYPAECVNPPDGTTTEQWIKEGFPGSSCLLP